MKLDVIRIDKVDPNPDNPRGIDISTEDPYLNLLKDSIKRFGVMVPILVVAEKGRYFLLDGERRYHASKAVGKDTIPAYVLSTSESKDLDESEMLYRMFQIHHVRSDWGPIQQCKALEGDYHRISHNRRPRVGDDLRSQLADISKELALRTGIDKRTAFDRIKFLRWPRRIKNALYDRPDDRSYSYIIEIEDKIVIPALINYPEYFERVPADDVRADLYLKLPMISGRSDVRLVAPYFRRKAKTKADRAKVVRVLRQLHTVRDMTYEEAEEELEEAWPELERLPAPTPRQLLTLLKTLDQKLQMFNPETINHANRRAKARPREILAAAAAVIESLRRLVEELSEVEV
jgi:hypothetical protein